MLAISVELPGAHWPAVVSAWEQLHHRLLDRRGDEDQVCWWRVPIDTSYLPLKKSDRG
jgi:hypothetical protein